MMFDVDAVKERLKSFGYEVRAEEESALTFCVGGVCSKIKNKTNQSEVPEGLEYVAVNMAVGEYLLLKKTFAPEELKMFDFDVAIKQVQAGDTNTVFAVESSLTAEQKLTAFINYLLSSGAAEFSAYRKFRW